MKVYVISSPKNRSLAGKLLSGIKNVKMISGQSEEPGSSFSMAMKKKIESANAFLVIIDDEFSKSAALNTELQLAEMSVSRNSNRVLIPVILNNADIPASIMGTLYIACSSNSERDLCKAKLMVEGVLINRWQNSAVKKSNPYAVKKMVILILYLLCEILLFLLYGSIYTILYYYTDQYYDIFYLNLVKMLYYFLSFSILILFILSFSKIKLNESSEYEIRRYSQRLNRQIASHPAAQEQTPAENDNNKKMDALSLMNLNLVEIKEFYTWSQEQAKASFTLAVVMCVLGLVSIALAIFSPIILKLNFQISIIPAIGGVITELIALTSLSVYRSSLLQLNYYHKSLHEDERFLSSVNLIEKLSTQAAQDNMLQEIIRSEIQMNLSGMHENAESDHSGTKKPRLGWHHSSTSPEQ